MKVIALCGNLPDLDNGGWNFPNVCAKYPGSGWCAEFDRMSSLRGWTVLSGSQAKRLVEDGQIQANEVHVVQEEFNENGQWLVAQGADPSLVFTMESPIYTPRFYQAIPEMRSRFRRQMLFDGGSDHMHFPGFDARSIPEPMPWDARRFMVAVVGYKFGAAGWIPGELHSKRIEAIEYFGSRGALDLFGKGWPERVPAIADGHKIDVIANYKFALSFENGSYPGYITEKVIDCFVAGVIPVYWGPPDASQWLDPKAYIDASAFPNWQTLDSHLRELSAEDAMTMIHAGREFLGSALGRKHSYQGFAESVCASLGLEE